MARANGRKGARRNGTQPMRLVGVQNGSGNAVARRAAFGGRRGKKVRNGNGGVNVDALTDARCPMHLALPRAIAPYTVIRTTQAIGITGQTAGVGTLVIFGPMREFGQGGPETPQWSNVVAVSGVDHGTAINATTNAKLHTLDSVSATSLSTSSCTPSAFTVQVLNANALQTTTGIVYGGRSGQVLRLAGSTDTWNTLSSELLSYTSPRLMVASKLALRGVICHAVPADMNEMSEFTRLAYRITGNYTWAATSGLRHAGMLPMWFYVPADLTLSFVVTVEWRTRFEPGNPAHASHVYHKPASTATWDKVVSSAVNTGHAIKDIVETAAMVGRAYQAVRGVGQMPAIAVD